MIGEIGGWEGNYSSERTNVPTYGGQSAGFGISAGDQQYVNGIRSVSVSRGPSDGGTGSSPNVFVRQEFTRSPSLGVRGLLANKQNPILENR